MENSGRGLNHWTLQSLELLRPVAEAIHLECLAKSYLQLGRLERSDKDSLKGCPKGMSGGEDQTPIKELAPGTGKTRTGYVWVLNDPCPGDLEQALGESALDWEGIFQCDGCSVYPSHQKNHPELIDLGSCMAHI